MRPTALELISYLDEAYSDRIMPALTDPYVRNRANILSQIIGALHQRWTFEGPMLLADNADLRALLESARTALPDVDVDGPLERARAEEPSPDEYPTIAKLTAVNNALREGLVACIGALPLQVGDDLRGVEAELHAYLRRQLDRELRICAAPVFGEGEGIGRRPDLPRA